MRGGRGGRSGGVGIMVELEWTVHCKIAILSGGKSTEISMQESIDFCSFLHNCPKWNNFLFLRYPVGTTSLRELGTGKIVLILVHANFTGASSEFSTINR